MFVNKLKLIYGIESNEVVIANDLINTLFYFDQVNCGKLLVKVYLNCFMFCIY
jgi:hypothetical protein